MGIKSTHTIHRSVAKQIINGINIDDLSDDVISNILEMLPQSEYRNYIILNDTDVLPLDDRHSITSKEQFYNK